jgi:hypothetical protein
MDRTSWYRGMATAVTGPYASDYFLWGHLKSVICIDRPRNVQELQNKMRSECDKITTDMSRGGCKQLLSSVSISASKLVANNLNICLNKDDSTVNPMGCVFGPLCNAFSLSRENNVGSSFLI